MALSKDDLMVLAEAAAKYPAGTKGDSFFSDRDIPGFRGTLNRVSEDPGCLQFA